MENHGLVVENLAVAKFKVGFFKLRWETMFNVLTDLWSVAGIRPHMSHGLFGAVQEPDQLKEFLLLCQDSELWFFIKSSRFFAILCEKGRRWGLVCRCHPVLCKKGLPCPDGMKSRRLPEVWGYVEWWCLEAVDYRTKLNLVGDCGGSTELYESVKNLYDDGSAQLREKKGYVRLIPWRFARCSTPEEANECITQ